MRLLLLLLSLAGTQASVAMEVKFRLSTEPNGAEVRVAGRLLGLTPLAFNLPVGWDGLAKAEVSLTLKGYEPLRVALGSDREVFIEQPLQPLPSQSSRPLRSARRARKPVKALEPFPEVRAPQSGVASTSLPAASEARVTKEAWGQIEMEPKTVLAFQLEAERVAGEELPLPRATLDAYAASHLYATTLRGRYRLCVDTQGRVYTVTILEEIGDGLDERLVDGIKATWRYKPQTVPLCGQHAFTLRIR